MSQMFDTATLAAWFSNQPNIDVEHLSDLIVGHFGEKSKKHRSAKKLERCLILS
ncbi:hypothetical protein ACQ0MK_17940 [Thalassospira lucentensis]|uniref:hypothetical protein n=1 Tax=Thalassospira lucentensis TaxID=168935 RepID=UPI003D2EBCA0